MNIAERIYETVKDMPPTQAAEVLDFAEYVKSKHPIPPLGQSDEEARRERASLQAMVQAQPLQTQSAADFVRGLRDEARY